MHKFPYPLTSCTNPITGDVQLALVVNQRLIANPTRVDGGQRVVDPQEHFGLSAEDVSEFNRLNDVLTKATESALDAGCASIQDAIGVDSGDVAGVYFSGSPERQKVAEALAGYLLCEYNQSMTTEG